MKKIFTLLFLAAAVSASSQNPTTGCLTLNTGVCDLVIEDFSTNPTALFDLYGFVYSGTQPSGQTLRATGMTPSTSYNVTTPAPGYYLYTNGTVRTGFTLSTGTGTNNYFANGNTIHLTLQVFSANMLTLLAQCDYNLSAPGAYCFGISDADLVSGTRIRYRYTFTTTQNTSTAGGGPTIDFDNISIFSLTQAPLPVKFSSFTGRKISSLVNLTWNVETENNVDRYEIERSADGTRFATIGSVPATGDHSYSFNDMQPIAVGYYRIKSVDLDGKFGYSTIIAVRGSQSAVVIKAFLNNPTSLTIQHDAADKGASITVSTADGRVIRSVQPALGTQQTLVDLSAIAPGMLIVRYASANGAATIKLVKP